MLNLCQFIGNVGADPEIRLTQQSKKVASFSLAVTEKWKDASGEKQERTEWVRAVCFQEGLCRVIEAYIKKGSKLYVAGKQQTKQWEKDGVTRYSTEIIVQSIEMLDSGQQSGQQSGGYGGTQGGGFDDDSIPFAPIKLI